MTSILVTSSSFCLCPNALFHTLHRYVEPSFSLVGMMESTETVGESLGGRIEVGQNEITLH